MLAFFQVSQQKEELCSCQLMPGKVLRMSLVEDILDVLRLVLEYFGVPPDMVSAQTLSCYNCYHTKFSPEVFFLIS